MISTSLDGPKDLHDTNRPLQNKNLDHQAIIEKKLHMIREICRENQTASA